MSKGHTGYISVAAFAFVYWWKKDYLVQLIGTLF